MGVQWAGLFREIDYWLNLLRYVERMGWQPDTMSQAQEDENPVVAMSAALFVVTVAALGEEWLSRAVALGNTVVQVVVKKVVVGAKIAALVAQTVGRGHSLVDTIIAASTVQTVGREHSFEV